MWTTGPLVLLKIRPLLLLFFLTLPGGFDPLLRQTVAGPALKEIGGRTMGTSYSVRCVERQRGPRLEPQAAAVGAVLQDLNGKMSTYRPDSELMRFNSAQTIDWVPVSADLFEVLEESLDWNRRTGGAFDISAGTLVNLWGFGPSPSRFVTPPDAEIVRALQLVGHNLLELRRSPRAVRKRRPGLFLDLSAIAKGYAVDRVVDFLRASGLKDCLVEIGGELKGIGLNPRGQAWAVAVEDPAGGSPHYRVALSEQGVATSGDYRHFTRTEGLRLSHILDPRSGRPVSHNLASVTVIHPSTMTADALATSMLALGPQLGYELALREHIAALLVERRGQDYVETMTPAFKFLLLGEGRGNHD